MSCYTHPLLLSDDAALGFGFWTFAFAEPVPAYRRPGRCFVLKHGTPAQLRQPWTGGAYWVTSWPFGEYVKHRWPGAWVCSTFRKECGGVASDFIREAIGLTRGKWADVPALGMVTFIDKTKVPPIRVRGVETWGYSYVKAGFVPDGETEGGLLAFRMAPEAMPEPLAMPEAQAGLFVTASLAAGSIDSRKGAAL